MVQGDSGGVTAQLSGVDFDLISSTTLHGHWVSTLCLSSRLEELRLPRARPQTRSDHPGVEPLFPFSTVHCEAMITQVWNPFAPLLLCTVGSDQPGVEPLKFDQFDQV